MSNGAYCLLTKPSRAEQRLHPAHSTAQLACSLPILSAATVGCRPSQCKASRCRTLECWALRLGVLECRASGCEMQSLHPQNYTVKILWARWAELTIDPILLDRHLWSVQFEKFRLQIRLVWYFWCQCSVWFDVQSFFQVMNQFDSITWQLLLYFDRYIT